MVIFIIVYFIGAIVELVCDYFINKAILIEILSGDHLMEETMRLIKARRLRYKFVFILMRALFWPISIIVRTIWEIINKKHKSKDFVEYFCIK